MSNYSAYNSGCDPFSISESWLKSMRCVANALLTHGGRVTHICVTKLTSIGSDSGLSPDRRQAIFWTNAENCSLDPWEQFQWKFIHNSCIFIQEHAFENVVWKMAAILSRFVGRASLIYHVALRYISRIPDNHYAAHCFFHGSTCLNITRRRVVFIRRKRKSLLY